MHFLGKPDAQKAAAVQLGELLDVQFVAFNTQMIPKKVPQRLCVLRINWDVFGTGL